ncbi:MAG: YwaF family protein [Candidatus Izemoplasmatales bacterium]|nr:YwaF family protein [bacterium]MDZ4197140.1 YwaF family protein [Candidatus Izemoplasmatales bacterium]
MYDFQTAVFQNQAPTVFGPKHLVGSITIVIMIVVLLIILFQIVRLNNHSKALKVITIVLISLELTKYSHALITTGTFPLHYIPMQLCNFSLYLMPLVAFGKGRVRDFFLPTTFAVGLLAGLIVLLYPATVLGGEYAWLPFVPNIIPIISFLYHGVMIFFSIYLLVAKVYRPNIKDFYKVYVSLFVFAGMAMVTNAIFGTDMMFLNTAAGNPLQFILLTSGRAVYYLVMSILAAFLLFLPFAPSVFKSLIHSISKQSQVKNQEN